MGRPVDDDSAGREEEMRDDPFPTTISTGLRVSNLLRSAAILRGLVLSLLGSFHGAGR
jgi:hypothetical protein